MVPEAQASPPIAASKGAPRLHALDGLRAVAATLVLGHHLGGERLADALAGRGHQIAAFFARTAGTSGVELFFVMSGVVLTRPYLRWGRPFALLTYFRRRAVRLFPPYFVAWLLAGLTTYLYSSCPTWYTELANLPRFRLGTWFSQLGILYFGSHYNFAWWSLTVEVIFYLLVPVLVPFFLHVHGHRAAFLVLFGSLIVAVAVPICAPALARVLPDGVWNFVPYTSCFAAGLLLARMDFSRAAARASIALGAAGLCAAAVDPQNLLRHVGYGLVYSGVVSRALDPASRLSRILSAWHFVWFGERSYSLFLTHGSVIVLVCQAASAVMPRGGRDILVTRLIAVPVSVLVAMLLFSFVERRFAHGLVTDRFFWPWRVGAPPDQH